MAFCAKNGNSTPQHILEMANSINQALRAETYNTGTVTAADGASSVTVTDSRCGAGKLALLVPLNAAAGTAAWHLSAMTSGSMTFGVTGTGLRQFGYAILGAGKTE